jgi:hypothetical protein
VPAVAQQCCFQSISCDASCLIWFVNHGLSRPGSDHQEASCTVSMNQQHQRKPVKDPACTRDSQESLYILSSEQSRQPCMHTTGTGKGTFDWVDNFLEKNPSYVELSDRKIQDTILRARCAARYTSACNSAFPQMRGTLTSCHR